MSFMLSLPTFAKMLRSRFCRYFINALAGGTPGRIPTNSSLVLDDLANYFCTARSTARWLATTPKFLNHALFGFLHPLSLDVHRQTTSVKRVL